MPTAVKTARPSPQPFGGAEGVIFSQPTPRQRVEDTSVPLLRVGSWNVAGLRGLLRKDAGLASLRELSIVERLDVLMLQETKLQESHEAEVEPALLAASPHSPRVDNGVLKVRELYYYCTFPHITRVLLLLSWKNRVFLQGQLNMDRHARNK